ncbi:hypothetical protein GHT06_019301 [Daphnia sinensis]|uniref:peptidylprolyl isomerase n=1 Tax=Daphnia sinensis TaxID=1820382 RepID=A0AAD5KJW5_9CRUS|nr:hypothetical protein GHT06_019301 [Daphnia sinensis]
MEKHSTAANGAKLVELEDNAEVSDDVVSDSENEDDEIPMMFKQSVLKNKSIFEKQLLESTEIDPSEIFEMKAKQEVDGESKELSMKMDQQILEYFGGDEDEENKLLKLSSQMTPLPGFEGIFKKLGQAGEGGFPPIDSIVTIHYNGYLQDEVSNEIVSFDSSFLRGKPKSFMRGQGSVIEGLDIAVGSMKQKEQSEFIICPDLAWGEKGCPPRIPANAYIYFKIDLIEWVDSSAAEAFGKLPIQMRKKLPFQQVLEAAKSEKRKGTAYFEKQNFHLALKCYRRALGWIEDHSYADDEEESLGQKLRLTLHLDLALVNLKINKPKKTCIHAGEALELDPENPKAFYRLGLAKEKLGDFASARRNLLLAKNICPKDPSIARALLALNEKVQKEKYVETELCRKMLGSTTIRETPIASPTDESHKVIRCLLADFIQNPSEKQLEFPQGMSQNERNFLEEEANRLHLKFAMKPLMKGESICTVFKCG